MRAVIVISVLLILSSSFQPASAAVPIAPTLAISLSPASMNIISSAADSVSVSFNGTATVEKGRFDRNTYTMSLQSTVDTDWASAVKPAELTFSTSGSQSFTCTVEIPPAIDNTTATLSVQGSLDAGAMTIINTATSLLLVDNPAANQTTARQGTTTTRHVPATGAEPYVIAAVVVTVCIVAATGAMLLWRRRPR